MITSLLLAARNAFANSYHTTTLPPRTLYSTNKASFLIRPKGLLESNVVFQQVSIGCFIPPLAASFLLPQEHSWLLARPPHRPLCPAHGRHESERTQATFLLACIRAAGGRAAVFEPRFT